MQNALINIVTIFLGLSVGSKLAAEKFLTMQTLGILLLGLFAFCVGTAGGVLLAKLMNKFLKEQVQITYKETKYEDFIESLKSKNETK